MKIYNSIKKLASDSNNLKNLNLCSDFNKEIISLLELLEKINPCGQEYIVTNNTIVISYFLKLNLFNFVNMFPLRAKVQIIGLPISLSQKGYWGNQSSIEKIINEKKGFKIVLNGDTEFIKGVRTLSSFIFENKFSTFNEYLDNLRSSYRRRISKALSHRNDIEIRKLDRKNFNEKHYKLYLSIMQRTKNPLETLPKEFFNAYEAELYEFIDKKTKNILGFIQVKEIEYKLYFLFGGFRKEDTENFDIYYNMLLKIIEIGIEKHVKSIEFGQTAEESKMKVGCREVPKYLYVHHSNFIINCIIRLLVPLFSYKSYKVQHHVFK